ncbi:MAG TPA: hypothetical protein VM597_18375 [Gemmataceae bacterium]|jgi:hypothetical protein|nr:hypothetical protein [Gemmataceae bacterium]
MRLLLILLIASPLTAADHAVRFTAPAYFLPPFKTIVVTKAGEPGPGQPKHAAIASNSKLNQEVRLTTDGPFDVWLVPTDGLPVKAVAGLTAKESTEVKLNDHLGVIRVRSADQPRGKLLVTPHQDPGPEGKGHTVIQSASDTRAELAVPPGDYAVWVVPATGARARRIADKVRVQAGKTATVE